jgi:hypothetical protein
MVFRVCEVFRTFLMYWAGWWDEYFGLRDENLGEKI